jgi:3-hydroxyisobutyrate dehydrogenase-like beta-hydroxyacid dehydrogenase
VQAYDVYPPSVDKAVAGGCVAAKTPAAAAEGAKTLGLMVVNVKQVEDVLLGEPRVADSETGRE